jgi:hypothetical protein
LEIDELVFTERAEYQNDCDHNSVANHSYKVRHTVKARNDSLSVAHYTLYGHKKNDRTDANAHSECRNASEIDKAWSEHIFNYVKGVGEGV